MYATVPDFRDEGVTQARASDARLTALIEEASAVVNRITGQFFNPREMTLRMDGRGTRAVEPPYPPIVLTGLTINERRLSLEKEKVLIVGAPVGPGFSAPRISLERGVFHLGVENVVAEGIWGFTEDDGTPYGRTPLAVRRACMLLVMRMLPVMANTQEAADAKNAWRIIEEKTRDQSYKLGADTSSTVTGDPEIDRLLYPYSRPTGLGAA